MNENQIVSNKMITPDGTVLLSIGRHDYVTHRDKNGDMYFNDGGCEYLRRSINWETAVDHTVYNDAPFEVIREVMLWGTYGKAGDQPLYHVALKDMDTDHILAILETQHHIPVWRQERFQDELNLRDGK